MAQVKCNNHGVQEGKWVEGTKNGRAYAFWACPIREKDQFGNYIRCKVEVPNTPSGKFDQSLDKAGAQIDQSKKDELITRTAIAKSLIEAGHKLDDESKVKTLKAAETWLAWVTGKLQAANDLSPTTERLNEPDEIPLSEIPL